MRDFTVITQKKILNEIIQHFHPGRGYKTYEDGKFDGISAIIAVILDEYNEHRSRGSIYRTPTKNQICRCWIHPAPKP